MVNNGSPGVNLSRGVEDSKDDFSAPHLPGLPPGGFKSGGAELIGEPDRWKIPSRAREDPGNNGGVVDDVEVGEDDDDDENHGDDGDDGRPTGRPSWPSSRRNTVEEMLS